MIKNERLTAILLQVEQKFGRGDSSEWKNRDFEDLNFEINKKTKTIISALTLKRIFGKINTTDDYHPQKATIKALEQYADFILQSTPNSETKAEPEERITYCLENREKTTASKKGWAFFTIIIVIGIAVLWYFQHSNYKDELGKIVLLKTEGFNPKTASFQYTTPNKTDSFKISFDEDFKPIEVPNGSKTISYFYQSPGLYRVKMMKGKKIVSDTCTVLVQTKDWQSMAYYFEQGYKERYFSVPTKNSENSYFHPNTQTLNTAGIDTTKIIVLKLDNFHPTGADGDNFTLKTTVKNTDYWTGVHCNSIYLRVWGRKETIDLRFTNPGCSYWISCKLGEKTVNENNEDVSNFVFDISTWQNIRMENKNKHFELFINNVKRFTSSYSKTLGEIVGVSVMFHGSGYVKTYQLMDAQQKLLFKW